MIERFFSVLSIVVVVGALGGPARAESLQKPQNKEALKHYEDGAKQYNALGAFKAALEEFKASALIEQAPGTDYNLGQCYRMLAERIDEDATTKKEHLNKALWHYQRFLRTTSSTPQYAKLAEANLAKVQAALDELNNAEVATQPAPVASPSSTESSVALPQVAAAPEQPRDVGSQSRWYGDAFGWGLAGAGTLGLGASGLLFLDASSLRDDANMASTQQEKNRLHDKADTRSLTGTIIGIGSAAVLVAGIVKLAIHSEPSPSQSASWNLGASPNVVFVFGEF